MTDREQRTLSPTKVEKIIEKHGGLVALGAVRSEAARLLQCPASTCEPTETRRGEIHP
jgi:hypothetical protein